MISIFRFFALPRFLAFFFFTARRRTLRGHLPRALTTHSPCFSTKKCYRSACSPSLVVFFRFFVSFKCEVCSRSNSCRKRREEEGEEESTTDQCLACTFPPRTFSPSDFFFFVWSGTTVVLCSASFGLVWLGGGVAWRDGEQREKSEQVFVEEGCDATILNDEGVCAVSILRREKKNSAIKKIQPCSPQVRQRKYTAVVQYPHIPSV